MSKYAEPSLTLVSLPFTVSAVLTEGPLSDGKRYVAVNYAGVTLVVMRTGGALFITMRIAVSVAAISSGPLANGCDKPNEIGGKYTHLLS